MYEYDHRFHPSGAFLDEWFRLFLKHQFGDELRTQLLCQVSAPS